MSIPDQMQAVQLVSYNQDYQIRHDHATPSIEDPYDVIVKVAVASYCHTDSMVQAGIFKSKTPMIPGHEGAGTVVAVGPKAEADGWTVGQRVMCGLTVGACGTCDECRGPENQTHYCRNRKGALGILQDGFMAEYVRCDSRSCVKIPDNLSSLDAAPLSCAGRTIWRGVQLARNAEYANEYIGLVGAGGGLGHIGIQLAKAMGFKVIAIDARDEGLTLSREMGADFMVDARKGKDDVLREVRAATNGSLVGSTVCISDHETAAELACAITRPHGTVVQLAQPAKVEVPFTELIFRDIRIRGSLVASPGESREMLDFVVKHGIRVRTSRYSGLDKIGDLMAAVHHGGVSGKGLIVVDGGRLQQDLSLGAKM